MRCFDYDYDCADRRARGTIRQRGFVLVTVSGMGQCSGLKCTMDSRCQSDSCSFQKGSMDGSATLHMNVGNKAAIENASECADKIDGEEISQLFQCVGFVRCVSHSLWLERFVDFSYSG